MEEKQQEDDIFLDIPQPKKIKIGKSSVHGRGVFAVEDIGADEIVEMCPMVPLEFRIKYHKDPQLYNYLYTTACDCEECKMHGPQFLMVLGYGMIYNHQDTPNTTWKFKYKEKVAEVVSNRPIKSGEEIFVSYGQQYFSSRKKVTIGDIKICEKEGPLPPEWMTWIRENLSRGVTTEQIRDVLISNKFEEQLVRKALGEKQ